MGTSEPIQYTGMVPGAVGWITTCHAVYYHENWGLDRSFEIQVATELAAFAARLDPARDGLWIAWNGDRFAGSVAVDGDRREEGARLRWFIVEPASQGQGIGRTLLQKAVAFARDAGHDSLFLWTFQGLEPARALYQEAGFHLSESHEVSQWGQRILEQRFDLSLSP